MTGRRAFGRACRRTTLRPFTPLAPGGPYIVLANHLKQARSRHSGDISRLPQAKDNRRSDHDLEGDPGVLEQRRSGPAAPGNRTRTAGQSTISIPSQNPGTARLTIEMKRARLSIQLFGFRALTIATGMPISHDRMTESSAICAVRGPRRITMSPTLSARKKDRPSSPLAMSASHLEILHDQRVGEPELGHVSETLFLGKLGHAIRAENRGQWITRHHAHDQKNQHRDTEDSHRSETQASNYVTVH